MRCLVVDDEPLAIEILARFIKKVPFLELVDSFENAVEASTFLQHDKVDLLFLDIQMPDLNGLQLLQSLPEKPLVIFTSAYSQYALESYSLDAVDYLLKPILFERFLKAVNKAQKLKQLDESGSDIIGEEKEFIFIKSDTRYFKINYADIQYIEGMRDYVAVHTNGQKILTLMSMTNMLDNLPSADFMRVHKSYIVGLKHISMVQHNRIKIGEKEIPVSNTYKEGLMKYIENSGTH
ncbi:MAG: LytTR family DNA-binding domain-containing protein [Bacteroidota bacterium]